MKKELLLSRQDIDKIGKDTDYYVGEIVFDNEESYFVRIPGWSNRLVRMDKRNLPGVEKSFEAKSEAVKEKIKEGVMSDVARAIGVPSHLLQPKSLTPKFKNGDRVRVVNNPELPGPQREYIGRVGTVKHAVIMGGIAFRFGIDFDDVTVEESKYTGLAYSYFGDDDLAKAEEYNVGDMLRFSDGKVGVVKTVSRNGNGCLEMFFGPTEDDWKYVPLDGEYIEGVESLED